MHSTTFRRRAASHALLFLSLTACADAALSPGDASAGALGAVASPLVTPPLAWRPLRGPEAAGTFAVTPRGEILAGDDLGGLWRSADDGDSWTKLESLPPDVGVLALAVDRAGAIWAATTTGLVRSTDGGASWIPVGLEDKWVTQLAADDAGGMYAGAGGWSGGVYRSVDDGRSWTQVVPSVNPREFILHFLAAYKGDLVVGTHADNLLRARNFGESWDWGTIQFTDFYMPPATSIAITGEGTQLVALATGIARSTDGGDGWSLAFANGGVIQLAREGSGSIVALDYDHRVWRSSDDGRSWSRVSAPLHADYARAFVATPSGRLLVGTFEGVYGTIGRR